MTFTTLILSGGGVRGIALLGALSALQESKLLSHIETVVGISVGSLVATALVMGIKERDVYDLAMKLDLSAVRRTSVMNLMGQFGLDTGAGMIKFIGDFFAKHGFSSQITFAQLHKICGRTLRIGASNVNDGTLYFFSHETDPHCKITHALRMSCGIPFVFTMWRYNGQCYVDGAVKDNFPIHQFVTETESHEANGSKILGINLRDATDHKPHTISDFFDYADRIFSMLTSSLDEKTMKNLPHNCEVIEIPCERSSLLRVSQEVKEQLYALGVRCAERFVQSKTRSCHSDDGVQIKREGVRVRK